MEHIDNNLYDDNLIDDMAKRRTRSTLKQSTDRPKVNVDEVCERLKTHKVAKGTQILGVRTVAGYCKVIRLLSKELNNEDDIITLLEDFVSVDNHIKNKTVDGHPLATATLKNYYSALKSIAFLLNLTDDAKEFYKTRMFGFMQKSENERKENKPHDKFTLEFPKWEVVKDLHLKFKGKQKYSLNHLLVSFYTMVIPRRLDYFSIIYFDKEQRFRPSVRPKNRVEEVDERGNPYNYIYPLKNGQYKLTIGDYKTDKFHEIFQNTLPKNLSEVITGYIKENNIKSGEHLIVNSLRNPFKDADKSKAVSRAFGKVYTIKNADDKDNSLSVNNIRRIFISSMRNNEFKVKIPEWNESKYWGDMTTNERERVAFYTGHSLITNDSYRVIVPTRQNDNQEEPTEIAHEATPIEENSTETNNDSCEMCESIDVDMKEVLEAKLKYYEMEIKYIKKQLEKFSA